MVNTVRKGRETELEYKKLKEAQGFSCFKPIKSHRFVKQQDIFGHFDLICMNKDEVLLVQVKSADYRKGINKIKEFNNHPNQVKKILAIKRSNGQWEEFKAINND